MPGLVPGIHAFLSIKQDVDGWDKPGHDVASVECRRSYSAAARFSPACAEVM
jgi:2-oxoglutarate ferredoxin oxidoreductase subunit beta